MKWMTSLAIIFSCLVLTGCLLPSGERAENQIAYPDQLQSVEDAAIRFQADTGVLPIRTFDETTSYYQRYVVDFNQLIPRYLQQPPGTAFENGGVFQYVLVDVEDQPKAKVIDLTSQREIQQFQQRINEYRRQHTYVPVDEMLDVGLFKLDHEALNYKEAPQVKSPYYDTMLPLLYTNDGEIVIDYRIDLNIALNEFDHQFGEDEDIRSLLVEQFPFVPVRSVPYTLDQNNEPIYNVRLND
ncbi:hypothetical protein [Bacillus sp. FJAT-45037]|uniref:hypothetical protein n=1 Tax=Bacillus sp. FJAT-45037 TaxID=2011007 RepID=UPI000C24103D|nr:hypothetical protein [Bacillus sp. FJAT-45037]